jgi:tetratricopeptide (TPR) repeat protein
MDTEQILEQLLANPPDETSLAQPLPDDVSEAVVAHLKDEVDRNWYNDPHRSVRLSEIIICIGQQRSDLNQIALGTMARGDSLKYVGNLNDAWAELEQAGNLYLEAGNDFGWARTRIGRLAICVDLNRVEQSLQEAQQARAIFEKHQDIDRVIRLNLNAGIVFNRLGKQREALFLYEEALELAKASGAAGEIHLGGLFTSLGYSYCELGKIEQALHYFEQAQILATTRNESRRRVIAELNIAYIEQLRGRYRQALHHLHNVQELTEMSLPLENAYARRMQVECYLRLSRYEEAVQLARAVADDYHNFDAAYEKALTLWFLATGLTHLALNAIAQDTLDEAEIIFETIGATTWIANSQLQRGYLALQTGDLAGAHKRAVQAYGAFEASQEQVYIAEAALLLGQIHRHYQRWLEATQTALQALNIARAARHPVLQYSAHVLLGHIHEAQADQHRAMRHYQAAHLTVERMQRGLTITLRTGFLTNKLDAIQSQLRLYLKRNDVVCAFLTLERMKAQTLFSYLTRQENLQWVMRDDLVAQRVGELNRLREEHQWYYEMLHGDFTDPDRKSAYSREELTHELSQREKQMRGITERLYLESNNVMPDFTLPSLGEVQNSLASEQVMIAYYNDGTHLWAFTVGQQDCMVTPLPGTLAALDKLVQQFQFNVDCALAAGENAPALAQLTAMFHKLSQRLYDILIAPLRHQIEPYQRLTVVPYGSLHYLPFHLLCSREEYLIEKYELHVLPTANWVTQPVIQRDSGVLAIAHSWDKRLTQVVAEAQHVQQLFGGEIYAEDQAQRQVLANPPRQILHIAAHGEYRLDHPELSYIQLADGQMYTDDLWQHDLSYELVTLSACETGRANVMAGEELIGLGRGFLYAGAGALITSLWRIPDDTAHTIMTLVYSQLKAGATKAAALRAALLARRTAQPNQHPAFWGAFQLIGNAGPLSSIVVDKD